MVCFKFPILIFVITFGFLFSSCDDTDPEGPENPENPENPANPTFSEVNGFVITEDGTKLLATNNGLFEFDEANQTFTQQEVDDAFLALNDITTNYDNSEILWLASDQGVLNYTSQETLTTTNSGLHNNDVSVLNIDVNQIKYFAIPQALSINNRDSWVEYLGKTDQFIDYTVTDMGSTTDGYTYVTTDGGGVERFAFNDVDGISGATVFDTDWTYLKSNHVNTVYTYDSVQVYGTVMGVAFHFSEYTKWDWEPYTSEDGLVNDNVTSICRDANNIWWFGTTGGISSFDLNVWKSYTVESDSLLSNKIMFVEADADGAIWAICDLGITKIENKLIVNYEFPIEELQ